MNKRICVEFSNVDIMKMKMEGRTCGTHHTISLAFLESKAPIPVTDLYLYYTRLSRCQACEYYRGEYPKP